MTRAKHRCEILLTRIHGLSPTAKLTGGFGYIEHENGSAIQSVADVKEKDSFQVVLKDGSFSGIVTKIRKDKEAVYGSSKE